MNLRVVVEAGLYGVGTFRLQAIGSLTDLKGGSYPVKETFLFIYLQSALECVRVKTLVMRIVIFRSTTSPSSHCLPPWSKMPSPLLWMSTVASCLLFLFPPLPLFSLFYSQHSSSE